MSTATISLRRRTLVLAVAAGLVALTSACGSDGGGSPSGGATQSPTVGSSATVLRAADLRPGQKVPAPAESPVLRLTGRIGSTNTTSALALDIATIDRMGLTRVRLFEPWEKKTLEFRGVWLADLLAVAEISPAATTIQLTALDDYQVKLTMDEVRAGGVFLATHTGDGAPLAVAKGGPTRIVFTDGVPAGENADQWIWSLKSLDVR